MLYGTRSTVRTDTRPARWIALGVVSTVTAALIATMSATAGGATGDRFTCRASVLKLGNFEPYRANAQNDPCVADEEGMSGRRYVNSGLAVEGITSARTEVRGGAPRNRVVGAHSEVADAEWRRAGTTPLIHVKGVTSYARVDCATGSPVITSNSHVTGLELNGRTITAGSQPQRYNLGTWTLYLNRTIRQANEVIVRPVELVRPDGSTYLKLAEARAGRVGNPCTA